MDPNRPSNLFAVTIWTTAEPKWVWPSRCPAGISYMKGQLEKGASGKEHYQFYLRTDARIRRRGVNKLLGCHHAHVEACYKHEIANENYCSKSDTKVQKLPDLIFNFLEDRSVHPIDYLMTPHLQLVYGCYPEARDCGEAMSILLSDPNRFADRNKYKDWKSKPSEHSSQCRCMEKWDN